MKTSWDKLWEKMKNEKRSHCQLDPVSRAIFNFINKDIGDRPLSILETGCGTGRICIALAETNPSAKVTGTDISQDSIDLCHKGEQQKKLPNINFQKMDIYVLKFDDGNFDVTINEGVLQHLPDDLKGLKEMVRVTKNGGLVFVSVNNINNFPHTIYKFLKGKRYEHYPERSYKHRDLINMFKKAGLKDIELYGVQPGYGMQRIEGYLPLLGPIIAQLMYLLAFLLDPITNHWFSNQFGMQIVAKGRK